MLDARRHPLVTVEADQPCRAAVPGLTSRSRKPHRPARERVNRPSSPTDNNSSSADQVRAKFAMQQIYQGLPVLGRRFRWPQVVLGLLDQAEDGGGWVLSTIRSARRYAARSPRCRPTWVRTCSRPPNTMTAPVGRRCRRPPVRCPSWWQARSPGTAPRGTCSWSVLRRWSAP